MYQHLYSNRVYSLFSSLALWQGIEPGFAKIVYLTTSVMVIFFSHVLVPDEKGIEFLLKNWDHLIR